MQIQKLVIKKLYGYIDKDLTFNNDVNILVGINGSGKTSVLNLINWLLKPSLANLCVTEYEQIDLYFNFKNDDFKLTSKQDKVELTINMENITKSKIYNTIQATFRVHPSEITKNQANKEELSNSYRSLSAEPSEVESWNFLFKRVTDPVVIGLDRNIITEESDDFRTLNDRKGRFSEENFLGKMPLYRVIELARRNYGIFKSRTIDLNARLNNKIMLSSFDEVYSENNILELLNSKRITLRQVEDLEEKVMKYFEENKILKTNKQRFSNKIDENLLRIQSYFENLKTITLSQDREVDGNQSVGIAYLTNISHFRKIKKLIKEFEEFEESLKKYEKPIKDYLDAVNFFFKDSAKQLYFEKDSSELRYNILDKESRSIAGKRDIRTLSSGEQQILILLTYLKFYSAQGKLFIIDEPELSLHPKWQEDFLDQIIKVAPKGTQIIIATHSPAIVGKHEEFCKVLLPYNN